MRSSASCGLAAARARPPAPQAAGSPRPARPPASAARPPSPGHRRGSPPPRPAPHPRVRPAQAGPFTGGERLPKSPVMRGFCRAL
jgi:hypothetical protein